jgi:hypothetical protein
MRCPECKSVNFVRTRIQWWEVFLLLVLTRPFRCEGCLRRLYGFVWVKSKPRDSGRKIKPAIPPAKTASPQPALAKPEAAGQEPPRI